jgi:predicted phage-related endonuclease
MTNIAVSERKNWIGASESAALFGASPYTTKFELWHQKVGNIEVPDLDDVERIMAGQYLEPSIAAWAGAKWGMEIHDVPNYRPSSIVDQMGCSLDFETKSGDPVEIKNVDNLIFRDQWSSDGDIITDAPMHILVQIQHQLACPYEDLERPERSWLIVCVGGNRLYRMEVPRHDAMISRIEEEVKAFWHSVQAEAPPEPQFDLDSDAISLLYRGHGVELLDLRGNDRARDLAALYLDGLQDEKAGRNQKSAAMAELKTILGDAQAGFMDDGYTIKGSPIKETSSVKKAHFRFSIRKKKELQV